MVRAGRSRDLGWAGGGGGRGAAQACSGEKVAFDLTSYINSGYWLDVCLHGTVQLDN